MTTEAEQRNKGITTLLNGTNKAIKQIVPIEHSLSKPSLISEAINVQFGVLIGMVGDLNGKLVLAGDINVFGTIGEKMFGVAVSEEMLVSFSGEFGNMLAGNIATTIMHEDVSMDITSPSIIEGQAKISGFMLALQMKVSFTNIGDVDIYVMLD